MSRKSLVTLFITCIIAIASAGCGASMARVNYDRRIDTAFTQLQNGEPSHALHNLELAGEIGQENNYDQTELRHLSVEAHLGLGNNAEAHTQAKELLDGDPRDAYANELMGKVLLKEGRYTKAEKFFVIAQAGYESPVDTSRISDLIALARYFSAYERSNPRLAEHHLRKIQDPALQHAVDKAEKQITIRGL